MGAIQGILHLTVIVVGSVFVLLGGGVAAFMIYTASGQEEGE
jgi:hypothetical protein